MKSVHAVTAALVLLGLSIAVRADVFNLGLGLTNLETVRIGNPGNAADARRMSDGTAGYGSVSYTYGIGEYEVTAAQYCDFLNHKARSDLYALYTEYMWSFDHGCKTTRSGTPGSYSYSVAPDFANRPVNLVTYWSACRFANWLHNGQGNGDTETGAYTLNGYMAQDGRTIQRNAGWRWAVTSEDEWYKAAYYKGGGTNAGYWAYPTQSDTVPGRDMADASGKNANYSTETAVESGFLIGTPYYRTEVGEFQKSKSAYGTFDQGGNLWEWTEGIFHEYDAWVPRAVRGGSYFGDASYLLASYRNTSLNPTYSNGAVGFRVVQAVVPEPSSIIALAGALALLIGMRRSRARRRGQTHYYAPRYRQQA